MAAPALNLDLSAIAIGSPRVPDPIANALSIIQTTINSLGNAHIASDAAIEISKTALATFINWTDYSASVTLKKADGTTALTGTVRLFRYTRIGKFVLVQYVITDIANPSGSSIFFSLPVAPKTLATYNILIGSGVSQAVGDSTFRNGAAWLSNSFPTMAYQTYDAAGSNFGATSNQIYNTIMYEANS